MAPTFQLAGTAQSGINALTVAWPTHLTNDIGILVIETGGEGTTLSITAPAGWTAVTGSPVTGVATVAGSKLQVWWKRAASGAETSVTVPDSGDHQVARIFTFRGCRTSGNPWDVTTTGTKTTASTTATVPSLTTTVADTLYVAIVGRPDDSASTTHFGTLVNSNLTAIGAAGEAGTTSGHGGGFVVEYGTFAGPGSTGTGTLSKTASTTDTYLVLALRGPLVLLAAAGSFTETGNAANLIHAARLVAETGGFTFSGNPAGLSRNRSLVAAAGAFALNGNSAGTLAAFRTTGDVGRFYLPGRNQRLWSEAFDNAYWTKSNASITANATTAPNGTNTADALIENTTNSVGHSVERTTTFVTGRTYTHSCYVKSYPGPTTRYARIQLGNTTVFGGDTYINVNLATGAVLNTPPSGTTYTVTAEGNGWYRASITRQYTGAGTTQAPNIQIINTSGIGLFTGADGLSGIYIWGAQWEEASAVTAYEATGATLGADNAALVKGYSLTAGQGAFTLTGIAATFSAGKGLIAGTGVFTLGWRTWGSGGWDGGTWADFGENALLIYGKRLVAATGSFTFSGNATTRLRGTQLTAAAGSIAVNGNAAVVVRGYRPTGAAGAFNLTGNAATLRPLRYLSGGAGGFIETGQGAGILRGLRLTPAATGGYSVTGVAASLRPGRSILASAGSVALAGNPAGLRTTRILASAGTAFTVSGGAVFLRPARRIIAAAAGYLEAGNTAALRPARVLTAATAAFGFGGIAAILLRSRRLVSATGVFALSAPGATPRAARLVVSTSGALALTGKDALITRVTVRTILASPGGFLIAGQAATPLRGLRLTCANGLFTFTGTATQALRGYRLTASAASFALIGGAAAIRPQRSLLASVGTFAWTGQPAGFRRGARVTANTGVFALSGQTANYLRGLRVAAAVGNVLLTGNASTLGSPARTLLAGTGVLNLSGNSTTAGQGRGLNAATGVLTLGLGLRGWSVGGWDGTTWIDYANPGENASLLIGRRLVAAAGGLIETGTAAGLNRGRRLLAATGTFAVAASAAAFPTTHRLSSVAGGFALAGQPATPLAARRISSAAGVFLEAGQAANVLHHRTFQNTGPRSFSVSGNAALLLRGSILGGGGAYALTGVGAQVAKGSKLLAGKATFTLSGQALTRDRVAADAGNFLLTGSISTVRRTYQITALSGSLSLSPEFAWLKPIFGANTGDLGRPSASYGGSDRTDPFFLKPQYVHYNAIQKSRDLGAADNFRAELSGKVGGSTGTQTLFFRFQTLGESKIAVQLQSASGYLQRYLSAGLCDTNRRPVPLDEQGRAFTSAIHNDESGRKADQLPEGTYYATVSTNQWQATEFNLLISVVRYLEAIGVIEASAPLSGRLAMAKPVGTAIGTAPVNGRIVRPARIKNLSGSAGGSGLPSLTLVIPSGVALGQMLPSGRLKITWRLDGVAQGSDLSNGTLTSTNNYGGGYGY